MSDTRFPPRPACIETGSFVTKDGCYALRRDDGLEFWLEMDRIPLNLVDRPVRVQGKRYPANLIAVEGIGPA